MMTELLFLPWRHPSRSRRACLATLALAHGTRALLPAIAQEPGAERGFRIPHELTATAKTFL
jgi:hypothetical protein